MIKLPFVSVLTRFTFCSKLLLIQIMTPRLLVVYERTKVCSKLLLIQIMTPRLLVVYELKYVSKPHSDLINDSNFGFICVSCKHTILNFFDLTY